MSIAARNAILAGGGSQPSGGYWGLCFTAEDSNCVVNMSKTGTPPAVTLETSPDGMTWTAFDADGGTTPITLAAVGDKVYFRAGSGGNTSLSRSLLNNRRFTLSGHCGASGDVSSLLDASSSVLSLSERPYAFLGLFNGCASLTTAPLLPATTLGQNCYQRMFVGCSSLTVAPMLPATTAAATCYNAMFQGCSSLTSAPLLPIITLAQNCYVNLFGGCSSLVDIEVRFLEWSGATNNWLTNVAASGTFYCPTALGTDATITRGNSNCPAGWTVVNTDA